MPFAGAENAHVLPADDAGSVASVGVPVPTYRRSIFTPSSPMKTSIVIAPAMFTAPASTHCHTVFEDVERVAVYVVAPVTRTCTVWSLPLFE